MRAGETRKGGEWVREEGGGEWRRRKREKIGKEKMITPLEMNFFTSRARRSDLGRRKLTPAPVARPHRGRAARLVASGADWEC